MPRLSAVLRHERLSDRLQFGLIGDLLGRALEHDIETAIHEIAASGGQDAAGVLGEILRLALVRTSAKPDRVAVPHRDQRRDMRPAIGADRRKPKRVRVDHMLKAYRPGRRDGVGMAEAMDLSGHVGVHGGPRLFCRSGRCITSTDLA
jgi:hypothetical protein